MVLAERGPGALIIASRLSDEEDDAEPLELDDLEEDLSDDDDSGQLVVEDEEEEALPPTVRIGKEPEEGDDFGKGDEGF